MRILILTNKFPYPPKDGGALATLSLAKSISTLGVETTLLSQNTSKHYVDTNQLPEEINSAFDIQTVYIDNKIKALPLLLNFLFSQKPFTAVRFISKKFKKNLIEILQNKVIDVIQIEGLYLLPYISIIRKYSSAIIAYRAHNLEHEIWQRNAETEKNKLKKFYLTNLATRIKRMEKMLLTTYDLLIPITEKDAMGLNNLGNQKEHIVCPTGYDVSNNTNSLKQEKKESLSLFHIGSLDWRPNQEGLLWFIHNCWAQIHSLYPDLKFYIAGRNAPDNFISKIKYPGIEYFGEVESAKDFIQSKDLMIVPLLAGSGMRIKIIEGMALGKTIITTSIGAEGIQYIDGTNIFIANKPEAFVEKITLCLNNPEMCLRIGNEARLNILDNYDNIKIAEKLIAMYKKILIRNSI